MASEGNTNQQQPTRLQVEQPYYYDSYRSSNQELDSQVFDAEGKMLSPTPVTDKLIFGLNLCWAVTFVPILIWLDTLHAGLRSCHLGEQARNKSPLWFNCGIYFGNATAVIGNDVLLEGNE